MPTVERDDGIELFWDEQGDGPALLLAHSYIQHPAVLQGLVDVLLEGHRVIRYDARGAGRSTRKGPYDMATDVADLIAVTEEAGPIAAVVSNGDSTNRAVHAAAQRPDLFPYVVSLETVPLEPGQAEGTDALVASSSVLDAMVSTMRVDFRTGLMAAIQRGNPDMSDDDLRERVDATAAYVEHEAALGRLEAWIGDDPAGDPQRLGERLVVAYEGSGAWFPADLTERGSDLLPGVRFIKLEGGAITRPELTAAVISGVTGAAAPS